MSTALDVKSSVISSAVFGGELNCLFVFSILLKVCTFLRNRFQEIRDIARNTLTKIMEVLGVQYLLYILKEMKSTLVHGYQVMLKLFFFCSL